MKSFNQIKEEKDNFNGKFNMSKVNDLVNMIDEMALDHDITLSKISLDDLKEMLNDLNDLSDSQLKSLYLYTDKIAPEKLRESDKIKMFFLKKCLETK